jgi:hypothetical protein
MVTKHFNEPRELAYGAIHAELFQEKTSWINRDSSTIFAGKTQRDLLIFAMALGRLKGQKSDVKDRQSNIPVSNMPEKQKWAILSIALAEHNDLMCLKDENPHYREAERYANEGLKILRSHIDKWGVDYPRYLEADLRDILKKSTKTLE